eukprot:10433686-Lingulodinium_polyedra.AAC.1
MSSAFQRLHPKHGGGLVRGAGGGELTRDDEFEALACGCTAIEALACGCAAIKNNYCSTQSDHKAQH